MAGIDEVLERLVAESEFREQLRADPAAALSGYVLDDEDLEVLAFTLDESAGGDHAVEQRTSKSALLMLLAAGLDAASAKPPLSGPGVSTPYPNMAAADGAEEADILVGKITPKGESDAASKLDPTQLGLDPAHISLDPADAPADHIETYPVISGARVGTEGQADPKLASDVDPEAAVNLSSPGAYGQEDAEEAADSHDRYANQEVSYLLQPGDDPPADEAHKGHSEVLATGFSTDDAEGVEDLAGAPERVESAVPEFDTSTGWDSSEAEGHGERDGVEIKQIQEVSGLKIEVDEIELKENTLDEASGEDAAAKDGAISIEGKDVTVKGRTRGDPPIEAGADDLADGDR